jgi:hypothetical protein
LAATGIASAENQDCGLFALHKITKSNRRFFHWQGTTGRILTTTTGKDGEPRARNWRSKVNPKVFRVS